MTSAGSPARVVVEADGGSRGNPGPAAYGALLRDADTAELIVESAGRLGTASNNVAEYRALIAGLELAAEYAPGAAVEVRMDSKLVIEQMAGRWKIKHADMRRLALQAQRLAPPRHHLDLGVPGPERRRRRTGQRGPRRPAPGRRPVPTPGRCPPTPTPEAAAREADQEERQRAAPQPPVPHDPLVGWRNVEHGEPTTSCCCATASPEHRGQAVLRLGRQRPRTHRRRVASRRSGRLSWWPAGATSRRRVLAAAANPRDRRRWPPTGSAWSRDRRRPGRARVRRVGRAHHRAGARALARRAGQAGSPTRTRAAGW